MKRPLLVALLMLVSLLAGCSSGPKDKVPDAPGLVVTDTTGGIRGLVVDQAVVPVPGAKIVASGGANTTSGKDGTFNFTGLQPGDYVLSVSKAGFLAVQASATVVAGEANPPIVKVLIERISTAQPYLDHFKLEGFYECAFSYGNPGSPVITDSCDMGVRTAYDGYNETQGGPPPVIPRNIQHNTNTQYLDVPSDTFSIVQEAFWTDESVPVLMVLLSSTPISNDCDCSDTDYMDNTMANPTYARLDRFDTAGKEDESFPLGQHVAARGFLSWEATSTAQNFEFTVITSMFHNYPAPDGWTFETKDQYPVG